MAKKSLPEVTVTLDRIIGGGQTIGTLSDGKKCLVWGGLPDEEVTVQLTKKKSSYVEGYVTNVITPSHERTEPRDPGSFLSTSPWQIMNFSAEKHYKAALIEEAFELHDIVLPVPIDVWSDGREYEYRNKVEFSFWYDTEKEELDLAFFRRGTHGKITVQGTSLATSDINNAANYALQALRDLKVDGRSLKTLLIRCNRAGKVAWQLYVKDEEFDANAVLEKAIAPEVICAEVIFSNPKSPASVITKRLASSSNDTLTDTILDVPFRYATEGFFQINLPVYEQALSDMKEWVVADKPVVDLYSGVGTIGLTIGGSDVTLVELNEHAVREMERNVAELHRVTEVKPILAASENALDYITGDATIIVDPPRAGLHEKVVEKLLVAAPERIIYLSCNPVTQARDVALLSEKYGIRHHRGYNFFPRTPHIEHLVVLDVIQKM
ncbi:MAG: class I SAM-dependent RNA methyltransferase [Candidatus Nomurabacteria bacterium]|nr:MAG: class I SAM-dependent RNA methyltransferase [Candidatus Nomurabacteria bacterium]